MTNLDKAVEAILSRYSILGTVRARDAAHTLEAAGLLMPDVQVIRTPEQLEELAQKDPNAVVLAGHVGVPRPACTLYEMYRAGQRWTLPAVVVATGAQVRAAREAMEQDNE